MSIEHDTTDVVTPTRVKNRLERAFDDNFVSPFQQFIKDETAGGVMLILATITALILANSVFHDEYEHILHASVVVGFGEWVLDMSLHHWINDGLMALFFFVVGLEIKREILLGELSSIKQAMLPIIAAIGGMVVPALMYAAVNGDGPSAHGWGIPMATDIAFAVGILVMLGKRVPTSLMTFLVALAIVDDLGAVAVIAIFYTDTIVVEALIASGGLLALLIALNAVGVRAVTPYFIVGTLLWLAMLKSGIHATVAGVLTAWVIPAKSHFEPKEFAGLVTDLFKRYEDNCKRKSTDEMLVSMNDQRRTVLKKLKYGVRLMETPLQRLEHALHVPVAFLIIPVFALANAGVAIDFAHVGNVLTQPAALGIGLGLVVGKLVGIAGSSIIAIKLGVAQMPRNAHTGHLIGVAMLGGIGFTMSIFIAELGFAGDHETLVVAKTAILFSSLIAGVIGFMLLRSMKPTAN